MFHADVIKDSIIEWIRDYFQDNGPTAPVVIGMSGGKDSTITASLCVDALGAHRVLGVIMPDGIQTDIMDAEDACNYLGISYIICNIRSIIKAQESAIMAIYNPWFNEITDPINDVVKFNNPPRIRMAMLYMIANQIGGRVANTCNMSETYVGYDTAWGDQCGDFAPLQNLTVTEVREIGEALKIPKRFIYKAPADGLCGMTDEQRFGFSYMALDNYIRGEQINKAIAAKIGEMHRRAEFKNERVCLPSFPYFPEGTCKLRKFQV